MNFKASARTLIVAASLTAALTVSAYAFDVQGGIVDTASAVNFRSQATTSSSVLDKLYDGTRIAVLDSADGWYKVAYEGKTGYMSADFVKTQDVMNITTCGAAKVTTEVLNLRKGPGTDTAVVAKLRENDVAEIIGINNGWLKVQFKGNTGYIAPDYVTIVASPAPAKTVAKASTPSSGSAPVSVATGTREQIVEFAETLLGCKYVYGGTTPKGFDCSGYVRYVFDAFGIDLSRTSSSQYSSSDKIKRSELEAGDLVFFSQRRGSSKVGHVGIYVGGDKFIHAASPGKGVRYDSLDSDYYSSHYIGCGRIITD